MRRVDPRHDGESRARCNKTLHLVLALSVSEFRCNKMLRQGRPTARFSSTKISGGGRKMSLSGSRVGMVGQLVSFVADTGRHDEVPAVRSTHDGAAERMRHIECGGGVGRALSGVWCVR